jgi:integrase
LYHRPVPDAQIVNQNNSGAHPWDRTFETAIQNRVAGLDSGKYARDTENNLQEFARWLATHRGVTSIEGIDEDDCRKYAQHLRDRVADDEGPLNSGASAQQKYAYLRAFLAWAVRDGLRDANPAKTERATEELPEDTGKSDRQFWTAREREAICATADAYVDASLDDESISRELAYRNRALVYVLGYSGCRGAELLNHPDDDTRNGITWADVDLENKVLQVFGKSREWEPTPLLSPAVDPLQKWSQQTPVDGADEPVFPRLDNAAKGIDPTPGMSTQAGRQALKRLCKWADYEFEEPLKPHGARRGLGHELYGESAETAQEVLRHQDIETTHESYRDQQTTELGERVESILSTTRNSE